MTEMQIAQQIFSRPASSDATMSLITGIAITSVTDGFAEVDIEGFTATADGSLMLPSLESGISIGDNVAVALYGPPEGPKKALILGVIGAEGGGSIEELEARMRAAEADIDQLQALTASQGTAITGLQSTVSSHTTSISNLGSRMTTAESDIDSLETRMGTAEDDIDALETTTSSQGSRITTLETQWGLHVISTLSEGYQITGKGVYEFDSIGGTLASRWSGSNVGDYSAICFDYAADGYAVLLCTSPRSNTLWIIKKWAGQFDYVRAI